MTNGGLIGTGMMYDGAASGYTCRNAVSCQNKVDDAKKAYEIAKGSSNEATARQALEAANKSCTSFVSSCSEAQDFYRGRTMVFGSVAFIGLIGILFGGILMIVGARKSSLKFQVKNHVKLILPRFLNFFAVDERRPPLFCTREVVDDRLSATPFQRHRVAHAFEIIEMEKPSRFPLMASGESKSICSKG